MKTIRLVVELTYDDQTMHDSTEESKEWFKEVLMDQEEGQLLLHSNGIGDTIGTIKVLEIQDSLPCPNVEEHKPQVISARSK